MIPRALLLVSHENAEVLSETLKRIPCWLARCELKDLKAQLKSNFFHCAIIEVHSLSDLETFKLIRETQPETRILAFSNAPKTSLVVKALKKGAFGFIEGLDPQEVLGQFTETVREACEQAPANEELGEKFDMVGRHPSMLQIFDVIEKIKDSDCNVLISGESGTGKELIAQAIHSSSKRGHRPFMAINCAAIPSSLIESELFGHVKGAFTGASHSRVGRFQQSGNGTLFLDEISELSIDLQAKLLRAIQTRQFEPVGALQSVSLNSRIIAASNQDLESAVNERSFREDLFYRLNVVPISIPPLRQRKSDIPLLVNNFLEKFSLQNKKQFLGTTEEAMAILMNYSWPGNVRELENLIERVVVLKQTNTMIEAKDFPANCFRSVSLDNFVSAVQLPESGLNLNQAVNDFENELILQALQKTKGNKNKAANLLNLNRTTLVEKMKRKKIQVA